MTIILDFGTWHVEAHNITATMTASAEDVSQNFTPDRIGVYLAHATSLRRASTSELAQAIGGIDLALDGTSSNTLIGRRMINPTDSIGVHKIATAAGGTIAVILILIIRDSIAE